MELRGQEAIQAFLSNPNKYKITNMGSVGASPALQQQLAMAMQPATSMAGQVPQAAQGGGGFTGFLKNVGQSLIDPFVKGGKVLAEGINYAKQGFDKGFDQDYDMRFFESGKDLGQSGLQSALGLASYAVPGAGITAGLGRAAALGGLSGALGSLSQQDFLDTNQDGKGFDFGQLALGTALGAGTGALTQGVGKAIARSRGNGAVVLDDALRGAEKNMRKAGLGDEVAATIGSTGKLGKVNSKLNALTNPQFRDKLGISLTDKQIVQAGKALQKQMPKSMRSGFEGRLLDDAIGRAQSNITQGATAGATSQTAKVAANEVQPYMPAMGDEGDVFMSTMNKANLDDATKKPLERMYNRLGVQAQAKVGKGSKAGVNWAPIRGTQDDIVKLEAARNFFGQPRTAEGLEETVQQVGRLRQEVLDNYATGFKFDVNDVQNTIPAQTLANRVTKGATKDEIGSAINNSLADFLNQVSPGMSADDLVQNRAVLGANQLQTLRDLTSQAAKNVYNNNGNFSSVGEAADFAINQFARKELGKVPGYTASNQVFSSFADMVPGMVNAYNRGAGGAYIASPRLSDNVMRYGLDFLNKGIEQGRLASAGLANKLSPVTSRVGNLADTAINNLPNIQRIGTSAAGIASTPAAQQTPDVLGMSTTGSISPDQAIMPDGTSVPMTGSTGTGMADQGSIANMFGGGSQMGMAQNPAQKIELLNVLLQATGGDLSTALQVGEVLGLGGMLGTQDPTTASGGTTKLTDKQTQFMNAGQVAADALNLLDQGATTGKLASAGNKVQEFFGAQNPIQTSYRSRLAMARGLAMNALAGANISPSEAERVAAAIPQETDEPAIARQKLQDFMQMMQMFGQSGGVSTNSMAAQPVMMY